jgi:integrase
MTPPGWLPQPVRLAGTAHNQAILALLWWTGVRRDDIAAMDVSNVNLDAGTLFIRDQKNDTTRPFPVVNADMHLKLSRWMRVRQTMHADTAALFVDIGRGGRSARQRMSADNVGQTITRIARAANVKVTTHSFRRAERSNWWRQATDRQIMTSWVDRQPDARPLRTCQRHDHRPGEFAGVR